MNMKIKKVDKIYCGYSLRHFFTNLESCLVANHIPYKKYDDEIEIGEDVVIITDGKLFNFEIL